MSRTIIQIPLILLLGCGSDNTGGDDEIGSACGLVEGEWDEQQQQNWVSAGAWLEPNYPKAEPFDDLEPHHFYLTAVHVIHLPPAYEMPGEDVPALLMYHGQHDERVWKIGNDPNTMLWYPLGHTVEWCDGDCAIPPAPEELSWGYPGLFCSGHTQLADGRVLVAGGNVNGNPKNGGLVQTFTFNRATANYLDATPSDPQIGEEVFGWTRNGDMVYDRWYPTLTMLKDGRVLISGGASRLLNGRNSFEVYDPNTNLVSQIFDEEGEEILWTAPGTMPTYPFMFLLPNGDVFYAGGEGASDAAFNGRVLIPDYNNDGDWAWLNGNGGLFDSKISGGSAVMYSPGKILKSGGLSSGYAVASAEIIDLSKCVSNDYSEGVGCDANFRSAGEMNHPRHYHTLTVLPDVESWRPEAIHAETAKLETHQAIHASTVKCPSAKSSAAIAPACQVTASMKPVHIRMVKHAPKTSSVVIHARLEMTAVQARHASTSIPGWT